MLDVLPQEIPGRQELWLLQLLSENAGLREASRRCGQPQTVLNRKLKRLERRLGVPLFEAHRDRYRLTRGGWSLLVAGTRLLSALESPHLGGTPAGREDRAEGALPTLRMAVPRTGCCDITDCIAGQVPTVLLSAESVQPADALDLFERCAVDAAYLWECGDPAQCRRPSTAEPVLEEPLWVALPAGHPSAGQEVVALPELAGDSWVVEAGESADDLLARACRGRITPRVGYVVEHESEMRGLVGHGQGVALVSPLTVVSRTSPFVIRPLVDAPTRRYTLITDPETVGPRLGRRLAAALRSAYVSTAERTNHAFRYSPSFPVTEETAAEAAAGDAGMAHAFALPPARRAQKRGAALEVEDLRLLRVVGKCGSLNRAAPVLLITQPALTRRIRRLEDRLGVQLLERGPRGTVLTQTAEDLLDAVHEAESGFVSVLLGLRGEPTT